jgi:hypothetical protein
MKAQSSSSATLKFASPEINVGLDAAKSEMPKPAKQPKQPKMPAGGKEPKMPKNTMVMVKQPKAKRMPKRNKM